MSELILIRHAETVNFGRCLAGRMPGTLLSEAGKAQAARLADRLLVTPIDVVYSSPLERARQTAQALGLPVHCHDAFHEIDYGQWTGQTFEALADDPRWREWNERRGTARAPGGESMIEVQARVVKGLESICAERAPARIAVVTHGDIIRSAILHFTGIPLDLIHRIEIGPASISRVDASPAWPRVLSLNECG